MAQPIDRWADFKAILRQLKQPEMHEHFETIIIDTVDIAYNLCEKYICVQNGVQTIAEIPFGRGYSLLEREFDESLRSILQMDYGIVLISHATDKTFTDEDGQEYNQIVPTLDKRASKITTRMADIIGYSRAVMNDDGNSETRLYMRGSKRFIAGSRFPDTPDYIKFTYDNLVNAIGDAVDALEARYGAEATTNEDSNLYVGNTSEQRDVADLIHDFNELAGTLAEKNDAFFLPRIQTIVNKNLGTGKKISDATPEQADLVEVALADLKDLAENNKDK